MQKLLEVINISSFKTTKITNPYNETDEVLELNINDGAVYRLNNVIKVSGTYTFSIWYKTNTNTTITLRILGDESRISSTTSWQKFDKTVTINSVTEQNNDIDIEVTNGAIAYFYEAYLSEGVSDTSWSPAPEDIDDTIESVKSEFTQTAEEINMSVKNIKGDVSNLNIQVGKIEQSVADNKGNISSLTTTIDGINATVKKQGESISSIDQKADKISQQVTNVKNELNSKIELTAGEITQKVEDVRSNLSSEIKQTSDRISQSVSDVNKNLSTRIDQTAKDIELNASKTEEIGTNVNSMMEGNLIVNGFGTSKDNTNFASWRYNGVDKFESYPSFTFTSPKSTYMNIFQKPIPIDVSKSYEFDMALKSVESNNKLYLAFDEYDIDGLYISPSMCMGFSESTTTLAKDLKKDDTIVYLKSVAGFQQSSLGHQLGLIFWDYKDSIGYQYPIGVYSRNFASNIYDWSDVNKTNNTITLRQPWTGGTHVAGTSVSQSNSSGHKYFNYKDKVAPTEWTRTNHTIAGIQKPYRFDETSFNSATKYIVFGIWNNYNPSDSQEKTLCISKVSFIESSLKNNLENNYYNKTETDAKLKVQSDNITAEVNKEVTTIKNNMAQNYYNKTETDSKFQIQSDSITSTVKKEVTTQVGNIEIGGRNLLLNTGFNTFNHWIKASSTNSLQKVDGWCEITIGGAWSGFRQEFIPEKNVEYIVSYEAYLVDTVAETTSIETDFGTPDQMLVISKTPEKYSLKLKYPNTLNGEINFVVKCNELGRKWRIRNIKLEKGNKATDWTPAPEDMATADSLADVNNSLTNTTNTLQTNINSTNKNLQDIQNSQKEVYEIISENKTQISSLTQRAEGFTMDFKTVNETVKQINDQFVTERDERYKYIKFIDGEIWLGKEVPIGEDDFKLVIKNDRISFLQNKAEVAYMSNNKLYVTDIHVTSSLQLGKFVWSSRANGNVGLRWIGN